MIGLLVQKASSVKNYYICFNICIYANFLSFLQSIFILLMYYWNEKVKRILKSELVRRGISNADLADMLGKIGVEETKSSIDSKISRGSFSASFLLQCLSVMGCGNIDIKDYGEQLSMAAEPGPEYNLKK